MILEPPPSALHQKAGIKVPYMRWIVAFALFSAALLNYVDRNVLGLLAATIQKDLHISNQEYASVVNFFLIAYTIANLLSGRVVDKLGVRLSLALFVTWWTIANACTGLARSLSSLCGLRFMLGLGEAGCYTASPKAVAEWFPIAERGAAVGLYSAGGAVGATIAPLMVALVADHFGWRWVFAVTPILASFWMLLWLWLYKNPATHPNITEAERNYLALNLPKPAPADPNSPRQSEWALWAQVLRDPLVWQLMLARLITDPVWYFFQFWLPKYLQNMRGLDQKGVSIMWMVFAAATAGFLLGGYFSGRLVARGCIPSASRIWVMFTSALLVPLTGLVPQMPSVMGVILIAMVVAYASTSWLSNITSLVVDIVPKQILGTAFGVIACGSALGGFFMNKGVAWFLDHRSYNDCFYILACLHPFAVLLIWNLRKRQAAL
ncbi:MAG: MFS transporter [Verrucomicrobia bacterium]|nr:MFS transporter [Verrucomicrobiota bacterium]